MLTDETGELAKLTVNALKESHFNAAQEYGLQL